jgi:hypothetical protein
VTEEGIRLQQRTGSRRTLVVLFLVLFAFAQPPLVYLLANRIEPRILGIPFLYVYLLVIYAGLIGVLLQAMRRR